MAICGIISGTPNKRIYQGDTKSMLEMRCVMRNGQINVNICNTFVYNFNSSCNSVKICVNIITYVNYKR